MYVHSKSIFYIFQYKHVFTPYLNVVVVDPCRRLLDVEISTMTVHYTPYTSVPPTLYVSTLSFVFRRPEFLEA